MTIIPRLVTRRLLSAAAVCGILAGGAHVAAAGSISAPMAVGVTVARSCSVHAQAAGSSSSLVRIGCASGAISSVLLGNRADAAAVPPGGHTFQVRTEPVSSDTSLRVVTLNF